MMALIRASPLKNQKIISVILIAISEFENPGFKNESIQFSNVQDVQFLI
jgi:hypothetical protein